MSRCYARIMFCAAAMAVLLVMAAPGWSLTLITPTPDQIVRENVKITIPLSSLPNGFFEKNDSGRPFLSISVGEPGKETFVEAVSAGSVLKKKDSVIIFWNSKEPYREPKDPMTDKYFKDGSYSLVVSVHEQTQTQSKITASTAVNVVLKNKVPRTNPAPGVNLTNRLPFGQVTTYDVHTGVQVFDKVGLPILGGLGISSDFKVIQSVEDVRAAGELLLRCSVGGNASVTLFGEKTMVLAGQDIKPQLYRLVNKYGNVLKRNMFKKQAKFTITDVLPVLPNKSVKEGDSWPESFVLKIEGLTNPVKLSGSCHLDSFEWERGQECAKLVSDLTGTSRISLNNGKIRSSGATLKVRAVTYFAYKTGKLIKREISLDFPAQIDANAGDYSQASQAATPTQFQEEDDEDVPGAAKKPAASAARPGETPGASATAFADSGGKMGSVQMNVVIQSEK